MLDIGTIKWENKKKLEHYKIEPETLRRHLLLCGGTGTGKTSLAMNMLNQLWTDHSVPFLVLEGSKPEYRHLLMNGEAFEEQGLIFLLGDETVSPLRLNPLHIMSGVRLSSHITALVELFTETFRLRSPLPQILNKALYNCYTVAGWDVLTNQSRRATEGSKPISVYPTLSDMRELISPTVREYLAPGRASEAESVLESVLDTLIAGPVGSMLNTQYTFPPGRLFNRPAVIELHAVSSGASASFVRGLLLLLLQEFRQTQGLAEELQHVLLIEDCPNMCNDNGETDDEQSTRRPLASLLSDGGAYGQAVIITCQTPSTLPTHILSNTNSKVIFNLSANKDLSTMRGCLPAGAQPAVDMAALEVGQALAWHAVTQNYTAVNITSERPARSDSAAESDEAVRLFMAEKLSGELPYYPCHHDASPESAMIHQLGGSIANDSMFQLCFQRYWLHIMEDLTQLVHYRPQIVAEVNRVLGRRAQTVHLPTVVYCALIQAGHRFFSHKGEDGFWRHTEQLVLEQRWQDLMRIAFDPDSDRKIDVEELRDFRNDYLEMTQREEGPLYGCKLCTSRCNYRYESATVGSDARTQFDFNSAINRVDALSSEAAAWFSRLLAEDMCGQSNLDLAYCLTLHLIQQLSMSYRAQEILLGKVRQSLQEMLAEEESDGLSPEVEAE